MSDEPFITSVAVESIGIHDHVRVFGRQQLLGTLVVSLGEGALLQSILRQAADPRRSFDRQLREAEQGVLDAMAAVDEEALHALLDDHARHSASPLQPAVQSELARRALGKGALP